jgi:pimeloyl-ACP methyl ester carboxylesterase
MTSPAPAASRRTFITAAALLGGALTTGERAVAKQAPAGRSQAGYATVDGLKVYYEIHGGPLTRGTPLVLLHGGMLSIETGFPPELIASLARKQPVIAIEQQGHGHTADRAEAHSVERMVADTVGVLRSLGVRRTDAIGHSMGGMIAVGLAIRHPELVRSLTAISATYSLDGMLPELVTMQRNPAHQPSAELIPLLPSAEHFASWQAHYKRAAPDPAAFEKVLGKLNSMLTGWKGWTEAELRSIRAPTLLIIGDNDFTRIEHAAEMKRLIPGAQLAVLPGTMHMSIMERGAWIEPMLAARLATRPA